MEIDRFYLLSALQTRAGAFIWGSFKAYRQELNGLAVLESYLNLTGKVRTSHNALMVWMGCSKGAARKYRTYFWACGKKGFINIIYGRDLPGKLTSGESRSKGDLKYYEFTELGRNILRLYWQKLVELEEREIRKGHSRPIGEKVKEGIERARAKGVKLGRPKKIIINV